MPFTESPLVRTSYGDQMIHDDDDDDRYDDDDDDDEDQSC